MQAVRPIVDEIDPRAAYRLLESSPSTALIDVRTRAEWAFVGVPDLSAIGRPFWLVEWARFPDMAPNPAFAEELCERLGDTVPDCLLFLCRSGARSMAAAQAIAAVLAAQGLETRCTNVGEGFEGDLDAEGHRGRINGWKARGLPWRQG